MVKKCKVIVNNDAVTVFDFNGVEVQVPSIKKNAAFVNVLFKDGQYKVVEDDYVESPAVTTKNVGKKKAGAKKTTIHEEEYDPDSLDEDDEY